MTASKTRILKECGQAVRPSRFLEYSKFLQACYEYLKEHLDSYSYIQFADDLGFSATNVVHLIIRGKRRLTLKGAAKVTTVLGLRGIDRQYLETLVQHNNARRPQDRSSLFEKLISLKNRDLANPIEQQQLDYYTSWYHPVIRELVGTVAIKRNETDFVNHIQPRVLPEQGRKSIELLEKLGLIRYDDQADRYVQVDQNISTGNEIQSLAVIGYHKEVIEIARDSITTIPSARRDISAVTVSVDDATAQRLKLEIQKFRKHLLAIASESTNPDHIYQINFQLFPFTK